MNLTIAQIEAITAGRKLSNETSTEVLVAAAMNRIAADQRIDNVTAGKVCGMLGAIFAALTQAGTDPLAAIAYTKPD